MSANPKLFLEHQNSQVSHALVLFGCTRILQTLAWGEIRRKKRKPDEFVPFCIERTSDWVELLSMAEITHTEQWVSLPQKTQILCGVASEPFFEKFADKSPKEHDRFLCHPGRPGFVSCLVFTSEAVEILDVIPSNFGHVL